MHLCALLVHEARHAEDLERHRHDRGPNDSSISYGGAWAAQYWYHWALANRSGAYLSDRQKIEAAYQAETVARAMFAYREPRIERPPLLVR